MDAYRGLFQREVGDWEFKAKGGVSKSHSTTNSFQEASDDPQNSSLFQVVVTHGFGKVLANICDLLKAQFIVYSVSFTYTHKHTHTYICSIYLSPSLQS